MFNESFLLSSVVEILATKHSLNFSSKIPKSIEGFLIINTGIPTISAIPTSMSFQGVDIHLSDKTCSSFVLGRNSASFIFICLNPKDSNAGRLFSLCHELAHLWLRQSVISNIYEDNNEIEILCNSIASKLLVDDKILHNLWSKRNQQVDLKEQISAIARKFSVSEECIARYLLDCDNISQEEYQELRELYNARWKYIQNKKGTGGPAYGLRMVAENGAYFTQQVLSQYHKGTILGAEASSLLGVKINHFNALTEHLPPRI